MSAARRRSAATAISNVFFIRAFLQGRRRGPPSLLSAAASGRPRPRYCPWYKGRPRAATVCPRAPAVLQGESPPYVLLSLFFRQHVLVFGLLRLHESLIVDGRARDARYLLGHDVSLVEAALFQPLFCDRERDRPRRRQPRKKRSFPGSSASGPFPRRSCPRT